MDHYAADVAAIVAHLDLRDAIHIGHSIGGGEATRYVARHGKGRVAKLVLIGAVAPIMLIRHGGTLAIRALTWPRDHFCRSTIAPRLSCPAR
jgi:pimeloyl-ACP methyl ester carboxylesterase